MALTVGPGLFRYGQAKSDMVTHKCGTAVRTCPVGDCLTKVFILMSILVQSPCQGQKRPPIPHGCC